MNARAGAMLGALLCSVPAYAQQEDEVIIVTGRGLEVPPGTAAYGSVEIDSDRLSNDPSHRIETILTDVAGVQQFRRSDSRSANPSAQGITLRALGGNATSRALVLLDGVPLADPFFGLIPFNAIRPEGLGNARITRGGGAGAFGAGALAGTIELESLTAPDIVLGASTGSRDSWELFGLGAARVGSGHVTLGGHWQRGDGFYTTPLAARVPASVPARYEDWSASVRAVFPAGEKGEVQARIAMFRDSRTLRFRGADSSTEGEDFSLRYVGRGDWQVDALAYVQRRDFSNKVISATRYTLTLDQRATPSTGLGARVELRPPMPEDHILRLGLDSRLASGRMIEDAYGVTGQITARRSAGGQNWVSGAYAEYDWNSGALTLTGGARVDHWRIADGFFTERDGAGLLTADRRYADRSGWRTSVRGGALWRVAPGLELRAAAYTGFRLPTLNELYRPFTLFPVTTLANEDLGLERQEGAEIGLNYRPAEGWSLGATLFDNRLKSAVANVTIGPNLRERQNIGAIRARGLELTASGVVGPLSFSASYAYADSRIKAPGTVLDRLRPAQSPLHMASATATVHPSDRATLSATMRYTGRQYEDDLNANTLPDALTVDGVAQFEVGRGLSIELRGENLFDAEVITRNIAGDIDLGAPRTLWIGIRFGDQGPTRSAE